MLSVRGIDFPGRISAATLKLFDDGTHGDIHANDGNYTNTFSDTVKEGTYLFHFYATGVTQDGNTFERDTEIQTYLSPRYSSEHSKIDVESIEGNEEIQRIRIIFTPMDSLGNHLGPGYASAISVNITWGQPIGELQDNLDGTYSQEFELPTSVAKDADISVQMRGEVKSVNWDDAPTPDDSEFLWMIIGLLFILLIVTIIIAYVKIRKLKEGES
jgi:hypothetical protein